MQSQSDEFVSSLIPAIKRKAEQFFENMEVNSIDELTTQLRFWFSKKYNLPMYGEVLNNYTVKDMLFEFYLHNHDNTDTIEKTEQTISDHSEELGNLFEQEFSQEEEEFLNETFGPWEFSEEKT